MGLLTSYIGNQMSTNPSDTGDFLANYFGSQLANANANPQANVKPQSTTISYNDDGSADVTHKQTIAKDSGLQTAPQAQPQYVNLANSAGPTVSYVPPVPVAPPAGTQPFQNAVGSQGAPQPIQMQGQPQQAQPYTPPQAPQGVFGRMIQAESGGQQYNPQGGILTSPAGAQGIAQIMPATGANPGYGIPPATPQELATPAGNLQFGQRYFEGMFNHFGQDPEKAAAAYNAGPGTIERAMQTADAKGGTWKDYIPDETKRYLEKVIPEGKKTAERIGPLVAGVPSSDVGMTPTEQAVHHIVLNSGDVNALGMGTYAGDHLIDPATKRAYADEHATQMERARGYQEAPKKAAELIANGGVGLQRALKDESEEGSYLKAYLFQRLGLHDLAKNEQQKLGAGDMWAQTMVNGKPAWIKYNGQGAPVKGYNAEGELTPKELVQTAGLMKNAEVGTQIYADPTQEGGGRYALRRINGRAEFIDTATGAVETNPNIINRLTPLGVAGTIGIQAESAYQKRGAGTQGQAAAEGYQVSPMPARPGASVYQQPSGNVPTQPGAVGTSQQNMAPGAPQGGPIAPSQPQVQPQVQAPAQPAVPLYQQKQMVERGGKRGETVDKVIDTEYRDQAMAGDSVSTVRKQQFNIFERPGVNADRLFGLYNASAENPTDQKLSIVRDIIGGKFRPEAEVSQRLAQLDLSPEEKSALMEYNTLNQKINAATLKQNSGPGSISDSEQRANREANVDITKVPALGAYNMMAQSQFTGDLARARLDWSATQTFSNAAQMDKAWRKESADLQKMYMDIAEKRAKWISDHGGTTAAVKQGYKLYPVPQYNPNTESWEKTKPLNEIITKKSAP